jgi:integrase
MRENEICQLSIQDILQDRGIYFFSLNVDNDKDIKNTHSIRQVPIHTKLLPDLLEYIKNKPNKLFTISATQFAKDFSKFKTSLGFSSKLVFHSFRHTVSNKLKQAQVDPSIIDEITGHAHSSSGMSLGRYANRYNIGILYSYLEKLEYDI